jgi:hypothetical protein
MKTILWNFVISHWLTVFLLILPYIITILGTDRIKSALALFSGKFSGIMVLTLSFILSGVSNLTVFLIIGYSNWFILAWLICWSASGFLTILWDKLIAAGLYEWILIVLKKFINK